MKKNLYTTEMVFKLGQIYQSLLYVLNDDGHDIYPHSDVMPFKSFMMVFTML